MDLDPLKYLFQCIHQTYCHNLFGVTPPPLLHKLSLDNFIAPNSLENFFPSSIHYLNLIVDVECVRCLLKKLNCLDRHSSKMASMYSTFHPKFGLRLGHVLRTS